MLKRIDLFKAKSIIEGLDYLNKIFSSKFMWHKLEKRKITDKIFNITLIREEPETGVNGHGCEHLLIFSQTLTDIFYSIEKTEIFKTYIAIKILFFPNSPIFDKNDFVFEEDANFISKKVRFLLLDLPCGEYTKKELEKIVRKRRK